MVIPVPLGFAAGVLTRYISAPCAPARPNLPSLATHNEPSGVTVALELNRGL